jgi:hypothetical protein
MYCPAGIVHCRRLPQLAPVRLTPNHHVEEEVARDDRAADEGAAAVSPGLPGTVRIPDTLTTK